MLVIIIHTSLSYMKGRIQYSDKIGKHSCVEGTAVISLCVTININYIIEYVISDVIVYTCIQKHTLILFL